MRCSLCTLLLLLMSLLTACNEHEARFYTAVERIQKVHNDITCAVNFFKVRGDRATLLKKLRLSEECLLIERHECAKALIDAPRSSQRKLLVSTQPVLAKKPIDQHADPLPYEYMIVGEKELFNSVNTLMLFDVLHDTTSKSWHEQQKTPLLSLLLQYGASMTYHRYAAQEAPLNINKADAIRKRDTVAIISRTALSVTLHNSLDRYIPFFLERMTKEEVQDVYGYHPMSFVLSHLWVFPLNEERTHELLQDMLVMEHLKPHDDEIETMSRVYINTLDTIVFNGGRNKIEIPLSSCIKMLCMLVDHCQNPETLCTIRACISQAEVVPFVFQLRTQRYINNLLRRRYADLKKAINEHYPADLASIISQYIFAWPVEVKE